jgi:hypothetical protein
VEDARVLDGQLVSDRRGEDGIKEAVARGDGRRSDVVVREERRAPRTDSARSQPAEFGIAESRNDVATQDDLVLLARSLPEVRALVEPALCIVPQPDPPGLGVEQSSAFETGTGSSEEGVRVALGRERRRGGVPDPVVGIPSLVAAGRESSNAPPGAPVPTRSHERDSKGFSG